MTVQTVRPDFLTQRQSSPSRRLPGGIQWRGRQVMIFIGQLKLAVIASAAAVTLAAGGLALSDVFSILASTGGVAVSAVTLVLMARKWIRERRQERRAGHRPPVRPPPLPLTRVTREDYARHLILWERYTTDLENYYRKQLGGEL